MIEIIKNTNYFRLSIISYEFPINSSNEYDRNWLNVKIEVNLYDQCWTSIYPALLTWELKRLEDWFQAISHKNGLDDTELVFFEPNIRFEIKKPNSRTENDLKIYFDAEFTPKLWDKSEDCFIEFFLEDFDLKQLIEALKQERNRFPIRD